MSKAEYLAAPEKRKNKIGRSDMRYLIKVQRGQQKTNKRAEIDKEIKLEKKASEKTRRISSGTIEMKRLKQLNGAATASQNTLLPEPKRGRKSKNPEIVLFDKSQQVFWKAFSIPYEKGDLSGRDYVELDEPPMTQTQVLEMDPEAVLWKDLDYNHIIPHEHLYVACCMCHLYMRSTNIGKTIQVNGSTKIKAGGTLSTFHAFQVPQTVRWLFVHHGECIELYNERQYGGK